VISLARTSGTRNRPYKKASNPQLPARINATRAKYLAADLESVSGYDAGPALAAGRASTPISVAFTATQTPKPGLRLSDSVASLVISAVSGWGGPVRNRTRSPRCSIRSMIVGQVLRGLPAGGKTWIEIAVGWMLRSTAPEIS